MMDFQSLGRAARSAPLPEIVHPRGARILVARDLDELSRYAAELFVTLAQRAGDVEGQRFTVALAGGETPGHLYSLLASSQYAPQVPWERVHVFWGDERHVPPDDPASNYRMAYDALLSRVPIPPQNVHRIRAELPDAHEAARTYEDDLRGFFGLQPSALPRFDLVLLGMGTDGHTASLFPRTDTLHDREQGVCNPPTSWEPTLLVAAPWVETLQAYRLTLTPRLLNNADVVVFLVSGERKAATLHAVLEGPLRPDLLPAQIIAPTNGTLLWLVDQAAAAQLQRQPATGS
jgi:6-phosphogluconolactonase